MVLLAKRMDQFNAYLGTEMNVLLTKMRGEGKDVINLGLGDPDVQPPEHMRAALRDAVYNPDNHHYPSFYSPKPLRQSIANWYSRRFGVVLDPDSEVLPLLGSSEGLFHIHYTLLDVGDTALVPDPSYPSYVAGVILAGGVVEKVPLLKENGFLPDLAAIPAEVARKAKLIWLNYPNNPTGASADAEFFPKLIAWAREYGVVIIFDNPYTDVSFDGYRPPSFLEFEGAKEVGVEFHSLSKSYNCCGWRVGMLVGNRQVVAGVAKVKSHADRGIYYPMQVAAIHALDGPTDFMEGRNRTFRERRDVVVGALRAMGLAVEAPKATFYVWSSIPAGYTSRDFCFDVLDDISVWMIPGSMYGQYGEGYFRIALTHPEKRLAEAMDRLGEWQRVRYPERLRARQTAMGA